MARGRRPRTTLNPSLGGRNLRRLREQAGLSLIELELRTDDKIGAAHIQRIESGKTAHPDRSTLDTVLLALGTAYRDRRAVLEAFGYTVPDSRPTDAEVDEIKTLCQPEIELATWPAYLIDVSQRILLWNRYMPALIGMRADDPGTQIFAGCSTLDLAFNPAYRTTFMIDNPDEVLPGVVSMLRYELQPFRTEPWCERLLERAHSFRGFTALWDQIDEQQFESLVYHIPMPIRLDVPNIGLLTFVVAGAQPIIDRRFRVVHYIPHGASALRQCADWAEAQGSL